MQDTITLLGSLMKLVCVETDVNGIYELPVVAGATVHAIDLSYHMHDFEYLSDIDYDTGLLIMPETAPYFDNDFQDISKVELRVEVGGGQCNKYLGNNSVLIKVANCVWEPYPFVQSNNIIDYRNVTAHIMNVEVLDVVDSDASTTFPVWQFFKGANPAVVVYDEHYHNNHPHNPLTPCRPGALLPSILPSSSSAKNFFTP